MTPNTMTERRAYALALPLRTSEVKVEMTLNTRLRQMVLRVGAADPAAVYSLTREQMVEALALALHGLRSYSDIDLISDIESLLLVSTTN